MRIYKHPHTRHPNTCKNREMCKITPLYVPLSKHSLPCQQQALAMNCLPHSKHSFPRQQQALTMNKLGKAPKSNPPPHTHAGVEKTPVIRTHVVEGLDSTNQQNAPTLVHMYTNTWVHIHVYAYIYIDTYVCIYTHIYMRLYTHTCTHIITYMLTHIYTQTENLSNDASTCPTISWTHIRMHAYTYIYVHTQ